MSSVTRRYLFAIYKDIESLDFDDLDKVCDRFFVMIPENVRYIPFALVKRLQRIGKGLKWISMEEADGRSISIQLSFLLGKLHNKLPRDIEFAVLSDEAAYDPLVHFVNSSGRNCVRVMTKNYIKSAAPDLKIKDNVFSQTVPPVQPQPTVRFSPVEITDEVKMKPTDQPFYGA